MTVASIKDKKTLVDAIIMMLGGCYVAVVFLQLT